LPAGAARRRAGGLCQGAYLKEAVRRYEEVWLPLLSARRLAGQVRLPAASAGQGARPPAAAGGSTRGGARAIRTRRAEGDDADWRQRRRRAVRARSAPDANAPAPRRASAPSHQPWHDLVPPLDVAFVWHVHRLQPSQYAADCQRLPDAQGQVLHVDLQQARSRGAAFRA
jgi:hypothetical protein